MNLENAGVRANDYLWVDTGGGEEIRRITSVTGADFEVDTALPTLGALPYRIGADLRGVPVGARVLVGSVRVPLNTGPYRVLSSSIAQLVVDRSFFAAADPVSVTVFTSFLRASAPGAMPADGVAAWPASVGATSVGYAVTATQAKAEFVELAFDAPTNLLARGVGVGDRLTLSTSPITTSSVLSVALDSVGIESTPYFSGKVSYTIESARYLAWLSLAEDVVGFLDNVDFEAADFAITRILSGAAAGALLGAGGPVGVFSAQIDALASLQDYVVPFERSIDNILRMLNEQGMDRAIDLFTSLRVVEFFGMHADGVSYSTHLIRTAADVTRQVAPTSRFAKSIMGSPEVRLRSRRLR